MTQDAAQHMTLRSAAAALWRRELRAAWRRRGARAEPLVFFTLVLLLFPLAVGVERAALAKFAPGIVCVAALFAVLLSAERLLRSDYEDGSLEQLLLAPQPLALAILVKCGAHWLLTGLPLAALAPLYAQLLFAPAETAWTMAAALLLATPLLTLISALGVSLTACLHGAGLLTALLTLPLYIPALVFAAGAIDAVMFGLPAGPHLAMLGAMLVLALAAVPPAAAFALRVTME